MLGKLVGLNNRFSFHNYSLSSFDVNISKLSEPPVNNSFNQYEEFSYAMSLALFDYKRKSGCDGFVLSISLLITSLTLGIASSALNFSIPSSGILFILFSTISN